MKLEFNGYKARRIVNVHKHVDGPWFWDKYSAHPYIGCRSGCEFCYLRGGYYHGSKDPEGFDRVIKVKINAIDLLQREISHLQPDLIACGDWQLPAENRYMLSRKMLEVVNEAGFPVFIIERSPLISRDLDILSDINRRTWAGVAFSMSNADPALKRAFEPRSPGIQQRLQTMQILAKVGILVGAALMPIIPLVGDDRAHLDEIIHLVKEHGGSFVLSAGLSMDGIQAERTLAAFIKIDLSLEMPVRKFYNWHKDGKPRYGPVKAYNQQQGLIVRDICAHYGLADRIPRYIPRDKLGINKRVAEQLFLKTYDLELDGGSDYQIWAYRKAAWTVDELSESILDIYQSKGIPGLLALPNIGKHIAEELVGWLTIWQGMNIIDRDKELGSP